MHSERHEYVQDKNKEFSFADEHAHVHMVVNVSNNLLMEQAIRIFWQYSKSKVFKEMLNFIKRYSKKHFWCNTVTAEFILSVKTQYKITSEYATFLNNCFCDMQRKDIKIRLQFN